MPVNKSKPALASPLYERENAVRISRSEQLASSSKRCIDHSRELCDAGRDLIAESQHLRSRSVKCPVCGNRSILILKRETPIPKRAGKRHLPTAVVGYRCSKGHVFLQSTKDPKEHAKK